MARDENERDLADIRRAAFDLRTRDPQEAVKVLRRAVKKAGEWEALAHGALGEILLDDFDDVDGALHHFEKLRALAPGLPAAELGLARTYGKSGRVGEAQEAYARAMAGMEKALAEGLDADDASAPVNEGLEESLLTALESAVEEREMLLHFPSDRRASTPSSALLDRAENARILDLEDDEGDSDVDDWSRYALLRGTLLALDGQIEDGLAVVERIADAAPLPPQLKERIRSVVFEAAEDWREAAQALGNSVDGDIGRLSAEDALRLAVLLTGADREPEARQLLEKLKSAHPSDKELIRDIDARLSNLPKPSLVTLGAGRGRSS